MAALSSLTAAGGVVGDTFTDASGKVYNLSIVFSDGVYAWVEADSSFSSYTTLAGAPDPTTLIAGTVFAVTNDGTNTGLWMVTGTAGSAGIGMIQV